MQPQTQMTSDGSFSLSFLNPPVIERARSSACSRTAQVLTIISDASDGSSVGVIPISHAIPARRSLSASFC